MHIQSGLLLLLVGVAWTIDQTCNGTIIRGIKYEEEIIKDGLDAPFQLSVDYSNNILYFTVTSIEDDELGLSTAFIDLNNGEYATITGISGTATTVDHKNHVVYLSSYDGIYAFDPATKNIKHIAALDNIIWQMFYKDRLYFTDLASSAPFVYEDGIAKNVTEVNVSDLDVTYIAVDKHYNIWIGNSNGELNCYIKSENKMVPAGKYDVNGFTVDVNENLYLSTADGLYSIGEDWSIEQLFKKSEVYGATFDADNNIIYADKNRIVRLRPTGVQCPS